MENDHVDNLPVTVENRPTEVFDLPSIHLPSTGGGFFRFAWMTVLRARSVELSVKAYAAAFEAYAEAKDSFAELAYAEIRYRCALDDLDNLDAIIHAKRTTAALEREKQMLDVKISVQIARNELARLEADHPDAQANQRTDAEVDPEVLELKQHFERPIALMEKTQLIKDEFFAKRGGEENLTDRERQYVVDMDEALDAAILRSRTGID